MTSVRRRGLLLLVVGGLLLGLPAGSAWAYNPITPSKADTTITLNGKNMSVEDVVDIARHGAKVRLTQGALQQQQDAYELVLRGARQGIPIYGFNRGGGAEREDVIFEGDPLSAENAPVLTQRQLNSYRRGSRHASGERHQGIGPEVQDEEIVRAQMAVGVNRLRYAVNTPAVSQMLIDFVNHRITPVVVARGTDGQGDLAQDSNIRAAMVGVGEVYYRGERMPAEIALARAGLQPLTPTVDSLGVYSGWPHNAYTDGQIALLLHEAKEMLDWSDLTFAMSMLGLNSSITPITAVPQGVRPYPYQNWQSRRLINILWGSYLFDLEPTAGRILQDPLSFRDYNQRNGSLWQAYRQLKRDLLIQINSNSRNPVVLPGARPSDSRELNTPWVRRYFVTGAGNRGGFVLSGSNFDSTTLNNDMESFVLSLAQSLVGAKERVQRFTDPFFTVITMSDLPEELRGTAPLGDGFAMSDLTAELKSLANPVPAEGMFTEEGIQDVQGFGRLKVAKARVAVDTAMYLISQELLTATHWMDIRRAQRSSRTFAAAPTAAWRAFRVLSPWQEDPDEQLNVPASQGLAYAFMKGNPAAGFLGADAEEPAFSARSVRSKTKRARSRARARRVSLRRYTRVAGGPAAAAARRP
jgi:histidine ammonia-lyase